jgi:hypothetical protein
VCSARQEVRCELTRWPDSGKRTDHDVRAEVCDLSMRVRSSSPGILRMLVLATVPHECPDDLEMLRIGCKPLVHSKSDRAETKEYHLRRFDRGVLDELRIGCVQY